MVLSRPVKVIIGALTAWPVLYIFLFFAFIATFIFWMSRLPSGGGSHSSGPPVAFLLLFAAHFATMLLMFGLITFYIVYLFKTDRVQQDKKAPAGTDGWRSVGIAGVEWGVPKPARSAKEAVVEIVESLPDDSSYDDIVRELVFNRMVERGLADVEAGRTISNEEMARSIESWRKG